MRSKLLATTALAGMVIMSSVAKAQFAVIDVANLQQNVQQTQQQIIELIRLLTQIELLIQQVTGTDFTITGALHDSLLDVQRVLGEGTAVIFQETASLEQFRGLFPETFEAIDTLENVVAVVRGQTQQLLDASRQAVQMQSLSAEAIEAVIGNVDDSLAESGTAVGQTHAVQAGNQISAQIATLLAQIQGSQLAAQRLDALEVAPVGSTEKAADQARIRFPEPDAFIGNGQGVTPDGWQ
jgi:P-type conjugative transfer protein TrbJ